MMHRIFVIVITTFSLLGFTSTVIAQDAKQLFSEGKELFAKEQYVDASKKFKAAYEIKPTWKLLYNIANCEMAAKRYGLALDAFEEYLADAGDEIPLERQDEVIKEAKRLREMVGTLNVKTVKGSEIFIDDVSRGVAPIPEGILVTGGKKHTVAVVVDGNVYATENIKVRVGANISLDLTETTNNTDSNVSKLSSKQDENNDDSINAVEKSDNDNGKALKTVGWVMTGIGAAALIGGGITGAMTLRKENELESACDSDGCTKDMTGTLDTRDTLALTSTILFGVGAASAVVGVVMIIAGNKKSKNESLTLTPMIGPNVAGAQLFLNF